MYGLSLAPADWICDLGQYIHFKELTKHFCIPHIDSDKILPVLIHNINIKIVEIKVYKSFE